MRNVAMLPHRTIHEFGVFIDMVMSDRKEYKKYREKWKVFTEKGDTHQEQVNAIILQWGRLFYEYCEDQYGKWTTEDDRFFKSQNSRDES